ncbi:hypothetical protein PR048_023448 [Dryococelus australis]|uniref:Integrase catalytic domain-containing protein n=1 Tax=Dryococelus australis TaxID=614101 RepID=A0ABQ9GU79_9NEOP|nr:hypothetical protein PR048_023448 [Dryococelus australis]
MVGGSRSAFNSSQTYHSSISVFVCTFWFVHTSVQFILNPTYYPQSNGQVENSVEVYKHKLRMVVRSGDAYSSQE